MKRILACCIISLAMVATSADMTVSEATEQSKIFFKGKKYDLAFKLALEGSTDDGDLLANLGCMYYEGKGCKKDVEKAIECWLAGEAKGNPRSIRHLAVCVDFPKKDYAKAQARLEKAAEAKESGANFYLGWMFEKGMSDGGVDQQKALEYYRKAALECPEPDAFVLSYYGRKLYEIDPTGGVRVMKNAAAQNNPWALCFLGDAYNSGCGGLPKDYLKAEECFRLAVEHAGNGHYKEYAVRALNAIIKMCEEGLVVGDAGKKVIECLNQILNTTTASMKDRIYAYERLGYVYESGKYGVSKDLIKALDYYKNADSGCSWYRSGVVYTDTKMKDLSKAVECFQKSVARNYGWGAIMLARNYIDNEKDRGGVQKAETVLRQMWEKCAKDEDLVCELLNVLELQCKYEDMKNLCIEAKKQIANCPRINRCLLSLLDMNVGVSKEMIDLKSVENYMKDLSDKGDGAASYLLSCYYRDGILGVIDEVKAQEMMRRAVQQGDCCALAEKARVEKDDKIAFELLQEALEKNSDCEDALQLVVVGIMEGRWLSYNDVLKYTEKWANTGSVQAIISLAGLYAFPDPKYNITIDFKKAKLYLQLAKEKLPKSRDYIDWNAQIELLSAWMTICPKNSSFVDQQKAFAVVKKYADNGVFSAFSMIASCYINGWGVERDKNKADYWYEKAFNFKGDPRFFNAPLHKEAMEDRRRAYNEDLKNYCQSR